MRGLPVKLQVDNVGCFKVSAISLVFKQDLEACCSMHICHPCFMVYGSSNPQFMIPCTLKHPSSHPSAQTTLHLGTGHTQPLPPNILSSRAFASPSVSSLLSLQR
eukprot:1159858-Pelagomonas_calceolata.AAC.16